MTRHNPMRNERYSPIFMGHFRVFIANESSNVDKLAFFNDLIKVYDAQRIPELLVLAIDLLCVKNAAKVIISRVL